MIPVNRRKALFLGVDALAALVVAKVGANRPRTSVAGGTTAAALPETSAAAVTLADDFTTLGTREIINRTIQDSTGTPYTWTQLYPSPAWRQGPFFSTGDPGVVEGKLIRRDPTSAMYPGLVLPDVPSHWEVDFFLDPNGTGGRSVFIHLFADTDGTKSTSEIPLHVVIGERSYDVKAVSTSGGDTVLTSFGDPAKATAKYPNLTRLAFGVKHTVKFDVVGDTVTITFPAATNITSPVTLTDARLRTARHDGGGPGVFLVLEDEADLANEPYNGFYAVRITLGSSGGGGTAPTVSSVAPSAAGQGAKNLPVTITGTGFVAGAVVSVSGAGVSVSQTSLTATQIKLNMSIAVGAVTGARMLTVTNPDQTKASASFTVTPKPQPTSASPSVGRGTTQLVTISGSGFVPGVKVQIVGRGFTVGTPTEVSAGSLKVSVAVANTVAVGTYKVTLTNPDGGKGSKSNCLTVT